MALPKKVTILGDVIPVKVSDKIEVLDKEELKNIREDVLGLAWVLEDRIWINKFLPATAQTRVLLHECWHHALYKSGVSQSLTPEIEEVLCQIFAKVYCELKKAKV